MGQRFRWVDDFYPHPNLVREIALRSEYFVPQGLYGQRSTKGYLPPGTVEKIQQAFGFERIAFVGAAHSTTHFYHCLSHGRQRTTFLAHIDGGRSEKHPLFSLIVYLALRPPKDSGTGLYRHRKTGLWQEPTAEDVRRLKASRGTLDKILEEDASRRGRWELLECCQNVFNRAVLFPAHWYHSSCRDFGTRLENGRLYQAFFFCGYPNVFES